MNKISLIANYLIEHAHILTDGIVDEIIKNFDFEVPAKDIDDARVMYVEFLKFLGESITCTEGSVPESLIKWSKENGEKTAHSGGHISDILLRYPETRIAFADYFLKLGLKHQLNTDEVVLILKRVNHMLDLSINETVFAFERRNQEILKTAKNEIDKLSSPIVPIQDGLAVLPLIGSIDSDRADHLINTVIPKIPAHEVTCLIIDFSGIITIDTTVSSHIFNVYKVLRLLGIQVIFTGIRPELASRVIESGADFSSFQVYATVKQAIEAM
ncbi:STAS domain-containing protein [Bacillus sp. MUM 13]|uniref:STAS domain-containing protein n=1 Tax=Bacillus sp. MUM 13 TaxID=1678001 RepID=UPI0008F59CCA|nr:STAS domain-containing protein [Bacillus sp. MUM 13]OIK12748.1 anti-anti-sigma factor [Bacillus sp. MUM 13]